VFGLLAFDRDGAAAEHAIAEDEELALKPRKLRHHEAAAIPLSALTAYQALFEQAHLKSDGTRLLVTAAAGGVGVMGVQLGKSAGAFVLGTCSKKNADFVRKLGANETINYEDGGFADWVKTVLEKPEERMVDVVLDCIGGDTLKKCFSIVRKGGTVISIAEPIKDDWPAVKARENDDVKTTFFVVEPNGDMLEKIVGLVDSEKLEPVIDKVLGLREGPEAFAELESGQFRGKTVLNCVGPGKD
jgi:NADPH:quinone reductase-like Zn-dependent oxidoreductase